MIFGYVFIEDEQMPEMCIIPSKPSSYSKPIPIRLLRETNSAMQLISNEEGLLVQNEANALILEPMRPNKLYLTPNLPEKPGFSVLKIKIVAKSDNMTDSEDYESENDVFYQRAENKWEPWEPNKARI